MGHGLNVSSLRSSAEKETVNPRNAQPRVCAVEPAPAAEPETYDEEFTFHEDAADEGPTSRSIEEDALIPFNELWSV